MARLPVAIWLLALTIFWPAAAAAADPSATAIQSVGMPSGFAQLTQTREMLVDVFFGGRMIGEATVLARPGHVRFKSPASVLERVPGLIVSTELSDAFAGNLDAHAALACSGAPSNGCGELSPALAGIIFDEPHFRVDLFINPRFLQLMRPQEQEYLAIPAAGPSLTSSTGIALSGSTGSAPSYTIQNRIVAGYRNARVRADIAYASHVGFVADTLVAQVDRPRVRYSAGLFWAPGLDLTGERRIVGAGVATQFDTRTDRDSLAGTPLVLFLAQASRVDILVDGRLVTSRQYDAGNNLIDTSSLPDGFYPVVLRIHQANGAVRDERRFFAKAPQIAPVGHPVYFAYAGKLANTRPGQPLSISKDIFYQLGAARRFGQSLAADVSVIGTSDKPMLEIGSWLITSVGRMRLAGLVSANGDRGALLQIASARAGPLNVNFDLRRVWSHDGSPLLPISTYAETFDSVPPDTRQLANGSFTQLTGNIGYQFGSAYLAVIGSLRKDEGVPLDYSVGPNLSWPFFNHSGVQVALQADAELTPATSAAFVGFRMLLNRGAYSLAGHVGERGIRSSDGSGPSKSRTVGEAAAQFSSGDAVGSQWSASAGVTRDIDSTAVHGEAALYSGFGNAHAELLHNVEGSHRTQYGLTAQLGAALDRNDAVLGGRELTESAVVVSVEGAPRDALFDVAVDGQKRARLRTGEQMPIFLEPYRAYSVTLRAVGAPSLSYDPSARTVTLYPGNVQHVSWHVEHLLTVFGRAVRRDGTPVANAMISGRRGFGESNRQGYFQVDTSPGDILSFEPEDGAKCKVSLGERDQRLDYEPVGRVLCE